MSISVPKNSQFFIMVEKIDGLITHTSLSVGYFMADGSPALLARIGKSNDIDDSFGNDAKMLFKEIMPTLKTDARLQGESLDSSSNIQKSYQAYEISIEQYKEFLNLVACIHQQQIEKYQLKALIDSNKKYDGENKGKRRMVEHGIRVHVPKSDDETNITFSEDRLDSKIDYQTQSARNSEQWETILAHVKKNADNIVLSNTCHTTAVDITESITGVKEQISRWFASKLDYSITIGPKGIPKDSFYVLPPPPTCNETYANPKTKETLDRLYSKLRNIPMNNPDAKDTRKKFDVVLKLYKEIAGQGNNISLKKLLDTVSKSKKDNQNVIEHFRDYGWGKSFFNSQTSTEKTFNKIISTLEKATPRS